MENLAKLAEEAAQHNISLDKEQLIAFLRYKAKCKSEKSGCRFPVSDMEIDISALDRPVMNPEKFEITLRNKGSESNIDSTRTHYMYRVRGLADKGEELEVIKVERFGDYPNYKYLVSTWTYTK